MRRVVLLVFAIGCGFAPTVTGVDVTGDAIADSPRDGIHIDAPVDARVCPAAPAGCTVFQCAGESSCYYSCGAGTAGAGKKTWTQSRDACGTMNLGCIATTNNVEEHTCLVANAMPSVDVSDIVWIGYRQVSGSTEPDGGWGYECDQSSTYVAGNWGMFEPNNNNSSTPGKEDCGVMIGMSWLDAGCGDQRRYVCELP